jgi:hypothetical protein
VACAGYSIASAGTYTSPFTPAQVAGSPVVGSQNSGLNSVYSANDQTVTPDLQNADYFVLHVVFSEGTASGGGNINVTHWNMLLGVNGNGTISPETEFLTNQPFDVLIDLLDNPLSYITDQPMQTTNLPDGDVIYIADHDYGLSSSASGAKTNIAAYFLITGTDAQNLRTFITAHPEIIVAPFNYSGGGSGFYRDSTIVTPGDNIYQNNNGVGSTFSGFEAAFQLQGFQTNVGERFFTLITGSGTAFDLGISVTNAEPAVTNRLEAAADLTGTPLWTPVTNFTFPGTSATLQITGQTNPVQFYRIRSGP